MTHKLHDIVRLNHDCNSGMKAGTVGILVKNCGFHRGNSLHFHALNKRGYAYGFMEAHHRGFVCRNKDRWIPPSRWWYFKNWFKQRGLI